MTVKVKRLDDKSIHHFTTELEFRDWYRKTMIASNNKLRVKVIRERDTKSNLDTRQIRYLGKGGEIRGISNERKFMASHPPSDTKAGRKVHRKLGYNRSQAV